MKDTLKLLTGILILFIILSGCPEPFSHSEDGEGIAISLSYTGSVAARSGRVAAPTPEMRSQMYCAGYSVGKKNNLKASVAKTEAFFRCIFLKSSHQAAFAAIL